MLRQRPDFGYNDLTVENIIMKENNGGSSIKSMPKWAAVCLLVLFSANLLIRISFVGLVPLWREDAFHYLNKAEEIVKGDFHVKEQDIGLPLYYAPFLALFGNGDIFNDIKIAQILLSLTEALIFLPLVLIALYLFGWQASLLAAAMFTFWNGLTYWSSMGYTEGLFSFLLLWGFYFLVRSTKRRSALVWAAVFSGLVFYVRVNGFVFLPMILIYALLLRRRIPGWNWKWVVIPVLVFLVVVTPYLAMRFGTYKSALHYDSGAKFLFADSHQQLFDPDFNPTLSQFLATHSLGKIIHRAWTGFKLVVLSTFNGNPFLFTLAVLGLLLYTRKKFLAFHMMYLFWWGGLFWIYAVIQSGRFLLPLHPFAIILGGAVVVSLLKDKPKAGIFAGLFLLVFLFLFGPKFLDTRSGLKYEGSVWKDSLVWAQWMNRNIPAGETIAIREGIDIVDMAAPQLELITIPYRDDFGAILDFLKKNKAGYIAVGTGGLEAADWGRIRALQELRRRSLAPFITQIFDNESLKWRMIVFRIDWDKEGMIYNRGPGDIWQGESLVTEGSSRFDPDASLDFAAVSPEGENSTLMLGPVRGIPAGSYRMRFRLKQEAADPESFFSTLEIVVVRHNQVLYKSTLHKSLGADKGYVDIEVFLTTKVKRDLHFRFKTQGKGRLWIDSISFLPAD